VAIAARICPDDFRLTLEQANPGGMSLEDYSLMREVIAGGGGYVGGQSVESYQGKLRNEAADGRLPYRAA
jgi:hypothetical protein